MSGSDRSEGAKILGFDRTDFFVWSILGIAFAALALAGIFALNYPYTEKHAKSAYYQAQCNKSAAAGYVPLDRDIVASKDSKKAASGEHQADKKPDYPDYCDLAAQYRAAVSAEYSNIGSWFTVALTAVGVFFLWITLLYTKGTLKAANDTNNATREIGQAQARAYLDASGCRIYEEETEIAVIVENSGQTPAKTFGLRYTVAHLSEGDEEWYSDFTGVKNWTKGRWASVGAVEKTTVACLTGLHKFDIFRSSSNKPQRILCIKGVVYYQTVFGEEFMSQFVFGTKVPIWFNDASVRDESMGDSRYRRLSRPPTVRLIAHQPVEDQSEQP